MGRGGGSVLIIIQQRKMVQDVQEKAHTYKPLGDWPNGGNGHEDGRQENMVAKRNAQRGAEAGVAALSCTLRLS